MCDEQRRAPAGEKTTPIGKDGWERLEVEWTVRHPHLMQADGTFQQKERREVTLTYPGNLGQQRTRIVSLSPRAALNLLAWLQEERETLERLAQEEEEGQP